MTVDLTKWPEAEAYFAYYSDGRFDGLSQLKFIYPAAEATVSHGGKTLNVGRPGVDGLEFSFRAGHPGIWVWYPIEDEWRKVAPDITSLEHAWLSGDLKV